MNLFLPISIVLYLIIVMNANNAEKGNKYSRLAIIMAGLCWAVVIGYWLVISFL